MSRDKHKVKHKKGEQIKPRNYLVPLMRRLKPGPFKDRRKKEYWKEWEKEYNE